MSSSLRRGFATFANPDMHRQASANAAHEEAAKAAAAAAAARDDVDAAREVISSLTNQLAGADQAADTVRELASCYCVALYQIWRCFI